MKLDLHVISINQENMTRLSSGLALLSLGFVLQGCGKPAKTDKPSSTEAGQSAGAVVVIQNAISQDINKNVEVTGSLTALQDVVVGARSLGRLAFVYPHEGDTVRAGQIVAVMDRADYDSQIRSANANLQSAINKKRQSEVLLSQAKNQYQQAKTTLDYTDKTTRTAIAIAQSQVQAAQEHLSVIKQGARAQERKQAEEQVASAKANYNKAQADLKRYQTLYREQAVSASQLDSMQSAFDAAQASYNSAQQALSLIREGARPEDIRTAELVVQQAQDSYRKAQADRDSVALRRGDVASAKVGIESAKAGIDAAQAGIAQAQAAVKIAQEALNNSYIKSPIDGIVAERRNEPGAQLGNGGAVMRIINPQSVYFQATLSENQYADLRINQSVNVTVDALPGRTFHGHVTRVLPVASSARSFTVRVDITPDSRLRPQMFARGSILVATHHNAIQVKKDGIIFDPATNAASLFVAENGKAVKRDVKVGYTNPQYTEILSGVAMGDKVIISGQNGLQNGDKIKIQ